MICLGINGIHSYGSLLRDRSNSQFLTVEHLAFLFETSECCLQGPTYHTSHSRRIESSLDAWKGQDFWTVQQEGLYSSQVFNINLHLLRSIFPLGLCAVSLY